MRYKVLDQKGLNYITVTMIDWIDDFVSTPRGVNKRRKVSACGGLAVCHTE